MTSYQKIPPEIWLKIIKPLTSEELLKLRRVSKHFNSLIERNRRYLFRDQRYDQSDQIYISGNRIDTISTSFRSKNLLKLRSYIRHSFVNLLRNPQIIGLNFLENSRKMNEGIIREIKLAARYDPEIFFGIKYLILGQMKFGDLKKILRIFGESLESLEISDEIRNDDLAGKLKRLIFPPNSSCCLKHLKISHKLNGDILERLLIHISPESSLESVHLDCSKTSGANQIRQTLINCRTPVKNVTKFSVTVTKSWLDDTPPKLWIKNTSELFKMFPLIKILRIDIICNRTVDQLDISGIAGEILEELKKRSQEKIMTLQISVIPNRGMIKYFRTGGLSEMIGSDVMASGEALVKIERIRYF